MSDIKGKLIKIGDTQEFGSNGFTKREFVIETPDQYPQQIPIEVIKDKCQLLDQFGVGDTVKVDYDLRGREWNGRYFSSVQAWKVELLEQAQTHAQTENVTGAVPVQDDSGIDDNVPF